MLLASSGSRVVSSTFQGTSVVLDPAVGGYLDLEWNKGGFGAGITLTLIDEIWLEDNFAGVHGTSPFPTTSRAGPDLTNTGETVIGGRIGYDWRDAIEGLYTTFHFARGYGAENSTSTARCSLPFRLGTRL